MSLSLWTRLFNWRQLRRTPKPPAFTLRAAESASTVDKGTTRVVRLTVTYSGTRYGGTLTPSTNSLPSGVTVTFSPATLTASDGFTDMSLIADSGAGSITDDAYTVTLSGTGINAKTINQTITVPNPLPPEAISIAPDDDTVSVVQGQTVDITYTLTREGAYTADVPLSVTGLPSGVTASYPDGQTFQGSDQTKRVRLTADIAAGTVTNDVFTVTAAGNGGSVADATDSGTVTVTAAPSGGGTPDAFDYFNYADQAALVAQMGTTGSGKLYSSTSSQGYSTGDLTLDTSTTYNGHPTVRFRFWDGRNIDPKLTTLASTTDDNVWISRVFKFSPGFCCDINNGYTGAKTYKFANHALGSTGRILGLFSTNGASTPGGTNNQGDYQWESQHRTGNANVASPYLVAVLRNLNNGSDNMVQNGLWYREVVHFQRVATGHTRTRIWVGLDGTTLPLLCTLDNRDLEYATPAGVGNMRFQDNFNATTAGPPATGVDQSMWLAEWERYNDSGTDDPLGYGYTVGLNVSVDMAITDDTIALTAGGATVQETITITRGSDIPNQGVDLYKGDLWPSGLNVSFSVSLLPNGTSTSVATFSASAAVAPGAYTVYIAARSVARKGYGVATDYLPLTITVS